MNNSKRARGWAFTLNNYTELEIHTLTQLKNDIGIKQYCFQEEICPKTGTPHLQGTMVWTNDKSFKYVIKINKRIHWRQYRNIKNSLAYCCKENTRSGKVYTYNYQPQSDHKRLPTDEEIRSELLRQALEDIDDIVNSLPKNWSRGI